MHAFTEAFASTSPIARVDSAPPDSLLAARREQLNREIEAAVIARAAADAAAAKLIAGLRSELEEVNTRCAELERAATAKRLAQKKAASRREQRGAPRMAVRTAIDMYSDSNLFTGFTGDLSCGGVFVQTVEVAEIGSELEVEFTLPDESVVKALSVVRWTQDVTDRCPQLVSGMGLQFIDLDAASIAALERFAQDRQPLFFPEA